MKKVLAMIDQLQSNPKFQAHFSKVKVFLQGEFPRGERLPKKPKHRIVIAVDKPSFNEWCQELGVSAKFNNNKPSYYEL